MRNRPSTSWTLPSCFDRPRTSSRNDPRSPGPSSSSRHSGPSRSPLRCPLWASPPNRPGRSSGPTPTPRSTMPWIRWNGRTPGSTASPSPSGFGAKGLISSFSLGALGIRDGSERIYFGERLLRSGEDYVIDYDIGQVTLLNPEALFGTDPQGRIRASWEQKALFQIAPTSIFGFNARYGLGDRGASTSSGSTRRSRPSRTAPSSGWSRRPSSWEG